MTWLTAKRRAAFEILKKQPYLSNRAIAKLINVSPHTVIAVRQRLGMFPTEPLEADGRQSRGRRSIPRPDWVELPSTVYRCYGRVPFRGKAPLLYIGSSMMVLQRLAAHSTTSPWYSELKTIELTHYPTIQAARRAEARAILRERPRYNQESN